jgi:hypothetical protein
MEKKFHYKNIEHRNLKGGKKVVRKVTIKNGKGHKSVSYYSKGKHQDTRKIPLTISEITNIKLGKFIPGLFSDCGCGSKNKTRKNRK